MKLVGTSLLSLIVFLNSDDSLVQAIALIATWTSLFIYCMKQER